MATKTENAEHVCTFCGNRNSDCKLIAGPNIIICAECVARCVEMVRRGDDVAQSDAGLTQAPDRQGGFSLLFFSKMRARRRVEPMCSFCGKPAPDLVHPPSTLDSHSLICSQCLALCQDIIGAAGPTR